MDINLFVYSQLELCLDGNARTKPLLQRLATFALAVKRAKRTRSPTYQKIMFRLNVFPGEFGQNIYDLVFDTEELTRPKGQPAKPKGQPARLEASQPEGLRL